MIAVDPVERAGVARARLENTLHNLAMLRLAQLRKDWRKAYPKRSLMVAYAHGLPIVSIDGRHVYIDSDLRTGYMTIAKAPGYPHRPIIAGGTTERRGPMWLLLAEAIEEVNEIAGQDIEPQGFDMVVTGRRYTVSYC